jgi:hypothetical protein
VDIEQPVAVSEEEEGENCREEICRIAASVEQRDATVNRD